jgi:hypothetical protein
MRLSARPAGLARLTRLAFAAAAVLISMSLLAPAARAGTTITGVMLYNANNTEGGSYASGGWYAPCDPPTGGMTLSGQGPCAPFSIDISAPGTYDFDYTTDRFLGLAEYAGIELLFDANSAPGITAYIATPTSTGLIAPSTSNRFCADYTACTASGGLQFVDGPVTVTATGFTVDNSTGPWTGDILLNVTSTVPEPASMALVPVGFLALGLAFQARRKGNRNR